MDGDLGKICDDNFPPMVNWAEFLHLNKFSNITSFYWVTSMLLIGAWYNNKGYMYLSESFFHVSKLLTAPACMAHLIYNTDKCFSNYPNLYQSSQVQ